MRRQVLDCRVRTLLPLPRKVRAGVPSRGPFSRVPKVQSADRDPRGSAPEAAPARLQRVTSARATARHVGSGFTWTFPALAIARRWTCKRAVDAEQLRSRRRRSLAGAAPAARAALGATRLGRRSKKIPPLASRQVDCKATLGIPETFRAAAGKVVRPVDVPANCGRSQPGGPTAPANSTSFDRRPEAAHAPELAPSKLTSSDRSP